MVSWDKKFSKKNLKKKCFEEKKIKKWWEKVWNGKISGIIKKITREKKGKKVDEKKFETEKLEKIIGKNLKKFFSSKFKLKEVWEEIL